MRKIFSFDNPNRSEAGNPKPKKRRVRKILKDVGAKIHPVKLVEQYLNSAEQARVSHSAKKDFTEDKPPGSLFPYMTGKERDEYFIRAGKEAQEKKMQKIRQEIQDLPESDEKKEDAA